MKARRQAEILRIIGERDIETQEQMLDQLERRGIRATQATISRDIKQLHLIKEPVGQGRYRYTVSSQRNRLNVADKLRTISGRALSALTLPRTSWSSRPCRVWPMRRAPLWTA